MLRTITEKFDFLKGHSQSAKSGFYIFLCIILSSLLLILSFPQTNYWFLAWVGLVPLMHVLDGQRAGQTFQISFFLGLIFFMSVMHWLTYVSNVGWIVLSIYFALYFGIFGLAFYVYNRERLWVKIFGLASVWVILEFLRGIIFSGLDWASLAYSQYTNLLMIQTADVTGKFGVSFLIVIVNVLIYELIKRGHPGEKIKSFVIVLIFVLSAIGYGQYQLKEKGPDDQNKQSMTISLVQGNIAQEIKWIQMLYPQILSKHFQLSLMAKQEQPDLIIWPETSFPGFWTEKNQSAAFLKDAIQEIQTPLLFGSIVEDGKKYFNSAVLLSNKGTQEERYDKVRLVPFGEYVPFRKQFPWLTEVVPIADFDAGKKFSVFSSLPQGRFSVLICFEDSFAPLARRFVKQGGAELLIGITNDAWFGDTKEAQLHLADSVFRAVENRRYFVRSANTGISCFINTKGKITSTLKDKEFKSTFVDGILTDKAYFNQDLTIYTRFGDVFVGLCLLMIIFSIFI